MRVKVKVCRACQKVCEWDSFGAGLSCCRACSQLGTTHYETEVEQMVQSDYLMRYKVAPEDTEPGEKIPDDDYGESWWFWCPGCNGHHSFRTKLSRTERAKDIELRKESGGKKALPVWTMTNSKPGHETFTPSLLINGNQCHLHVKDGAIDFCKDKCAHPLIGKKRVPFGKLP